MGVVPRASPERGCLPRVAQGLMALKGGQRICTECRRIRDPLEVLEPKGWLVTSSEGPFRKKTLLPVRS